MRTWHRWALRLLAALVGLGTIYWFTACDFGWGGPGATCKPEGALCDRDNECCSGRCRCADMSEYCTRCD